MKILSLIFFLLFASKGHSSTFEELNFPEERLVIGKFSNGKYIIPNEPRYHLFYEKAQHARGVLVSVGTFRSLAVGSMGNFSHIVLFDLDPGVVEFNKKQIEALKKSPTLSDFLANLLDEPAFSPIIKEALGSENKIPARSALTELYARMSRQQAIQRLNGNTGSGSLKMTAFEYLNKLLSYADFDKGHSFLTNPALYQKLHKLAVDGKIISVRGSLSGDYTLASLAEQLKSLNLEIGILDLSNSPDYIMIDPVGYKKYVQNLKLLPFSDSSLIQITTSSYKNGFEYGTMTAKAFIKAHEDLMAEVNAHFIYVEDYQSWLKEVLRLKNGNSLSNCNKLLENSDAKNK